MSNEEYGKIIAEIDSLPQGGITYKKINGKKYAYYQWREELKEIYTAYVDSKSVRVSSRRNTLSLHGSTGLHVCLLRKGKPRYR